MQGELRETQRNTRGGASVLAISLYHPITVVSRRTRSARRSEVADAEAAEAEERAVGIALLCHRWCHYGTRQQLLLPSLQGKGHQRPKL